MASPRGRWFEPLGAPVALLLFVTLAYFVGRPGWNQNSRLALVRALVDRGTVAIDADAHTTGDRARRAGHAYSDKAPGASLAAVPAYALFDGARRLAGADPPAMTARDALGREIPPGDADAARLPPGATVSFNATHRAALYVCALAAAALPTVAAAWAVAALALLAGANRRDAVGAAVLYVVATPALAYGTNFYGHQLAAGTLAAAAVLVLRRGPRPAAEGLWAGALLGWCVAAEYPTAPAAAALWLYGSHRRGPRFAGAAAATGGLWALGLAAYHTAAFGSPFATGYDAVELPRFAEGMRHRYGLGLPDPSVAFALLFGSYRGLFVAAPVAILAAFGLAVAVARRRAAAVLSAAMFVYFWLLNAGYYMWDGGSAAVGRHMLPGLPFLCVGLGQALARYRGAVLVVGSVSILHATAFATAGPEAPAFGSALYDYALPRLWNAAPRLDTPAGNLGLVLGLPGVVSLAPLGLVWWLRWPRRPAATTR